MALGADENGIYYLHAENGCLGGFRVPCVRAEFNPLVLREAVLLPSLDLTHLDGTQPHTVYQHSAGERATETHACRCLKNSVRQVSFPNVQNIVWVLKASL